MCDKSYFIAYALTEMIDIIPKDNKAEIYYMEKLKEDVFHKAPEICDHHWTDIYNYVSRVFSVDTEWEKKLCTTYNNLFIEYRDKFTEHPAPQDSQEVHD